MTMAIGNEWGLSDLQRASITGVVFSGELLGGLFWGPVADLYGRKKAFLCASFVIVTCGFASGAAPNYEWLLVFRAFVGFGVGGLTVPFDLLAEFLPVAERGRFLLYIEYFWTFGSLFVAGVAWGALDLIGWRGLSYITAIPVTFSSIAAFIYLPESPRWLLVKGRYTEAEDVVKAAAAVSGVTLQPFSLNTHMQPDDDINFEPKILDENITYIDLVRTPQIRGISIPLWIIWGAFGFTYYGIILFVSRLYTSPGSESDGDSTAICSFDYQSIFINACAEILGVFIAGLIIDPWGRTKTQGAKYTYRELYMFLSYINIYFYLFIYLCMYVCVYISIYIRM
jgi:MFS family permease